MKVKQQLEQNVVMGVIERRPYGVPTSTCHRYVYEKDCQHIVRLLPCIDDNLLHDVMTDLEQHWWTVIEFEVNRGEYIKNQKFRTLIFRTF